MTNEPPLSDVHPDPPGERDSGERVTRLPPEEAAASGIATRGGGRWAVRLRRLPLGLALGGLVGLVVKELDLSALVSYEGSQAGLVVAVSLLIGAVWALGFPRIVGMVVSAAAALWCIVAFTPLCAALADGLVLREILTEADAIFVSQAALSPGESGRAERWSRLFYGAELVVRRKAPVMVVSQSPDQTSGPSAREMLARHDLDETHLIVIAEKGNTRQEALGMAKLCAERNWELVIVVTSPIHSRRAAATMAFADVPAILAPAPETRYDIENLGQASDRISAFGSVIHERMGIVVYRLRGWL